LTNKFTVVTLVGEGCFQESDTPPIKGAGSGRSVSKQIKIGTLPYAHTVSPGSTKFWMATHVGRSVLGV